MQLALFDASTPKGSCTAVACICARRLGFLALFVWPAALPKKIGSCFTFWHVARATWHGSTRDRHHHRSGVPAHRMVPLPSRSDLPFDLQRSKCLNTHTHRLTNTFGQFFFDTLPRINLRNLKHAMHCFSSSDFGLFHVIDYFKRDCACPILNL